MHFFSNNKVLKIGLAFFVIQFFLAIYYAVERTVFIDIAYHIFSIAKDGDFAIQNYRFGAFFTQLLPLLGVKLGLSLKTIAVLYSLSFVLLYFSCFLILILYFKNEKLATAYLLFQSLLTTHTFFWIQSELPQGMVFLFIAFACIEKQLNTTKINLSSPLAVLILLLVVGFTHPLLIFPVVFGLLFYGMQFPKQKLMLLGYGVTFLLFYFIKAKFFSNAYDNEAFDKLNNFKSLFPNYFTIQSNKNFVRYVLQHYYLLIIVLIVATSFLFIKKQYKKLLLLSTFFIGYLLMINVSYHGGAEQFYLENQYLLLGFFVAFMFVYEVMPAWNYKKWMAFVLPIICILCIVRITIVGKEYTNRVEWLTNFMQSSKGKIILSATEVPQQLLKMTWASSFEFWLLSTMETDSSRSIIMEEKDKEFEEAIKNGKTFITKWNSYEYDKLNKKYFRFADTSFYEKYK